MSSAQIQMPELPRWEFPGVTTCLRDDDYADLKIVDISDIITTTSPTSAAARESVKCVFESLQQTGFVVLTGHGLTEESLSRQFNIGKLFIEVSEETKLRYHAKISEEGSWAGYKPLGFHKRPGGARDTTEFHDFYPDTVIEELQPPVSWPYLGEINDFYHYNHFVLLRAVLYILSEGLGLPPDSLWHLHHPQSDSSNIIRTKDMFRAGIYHPPAEEDREKSKRLWLPPHTDRGSVTFLYSQPVAGLQIFIDGQWKYVRHYPNGIVVNVGDMIEFVTGGLVKSALHQVHEPPSDQRHMRRLGMFYFATMRPGIPLEPLDLLASRAKPLESDVFHEFEGRIPTAEEWQVRRAKTTGKLADRALFNQRFPTQDSAVDGSTEGKEE